MHRPVFAANWKMNYGPTEARALLRTFLERHPPRTDRTVAIFPSAIAFSAAREALGERTDVVLGVQNIHTQPRGAFTGELSAAMASDAGASCCLVGHSERRQLFGETDADTAAKVRLAIDNGLTPVLCVGEQLAEREAGKTESVVLRQLEAGVSALESDEVARLVIAYEPVWAIGTGRTATPDDAAGVHHVLRRDLAARVGAKATSIPILYGGSVNKGNVGALLGARDVDGVLVGGASLDPEGWAAICAT